MSRKLLPPTVDLLIDHLDEMFPDACIKPSETPEAAHRRAGSRDVVTYLRTLQLKESTRELEAHKGF